MTVMNVCEKKPNHSNQYITIFMVSYFNKKLNFDPFMGTNDNNLLSHKYNKKIKYKYQI